jgi:ribose 5-phosphate isomerase B
VNLVIGSDHRGADAARALERRLLDAGHRITMCVPHATDACDYPEPAWVVGQAVATGQAERGILLCGTGIGTSIAANKVPGVRAAVVHDEITAELSRSHNDANVLCMSADLLGLRLIEKVTDLWLRTPFDGGRHERRIAKIARIERGDDPRADQP